MNEPEANGHTTITLGGATYKLHVPESFADREDIVRGFREAGKSPQKSRRIFAATLALCVPEVAALARPHTLDGCDEDLFAYGRLVYEAIRATGVSAAEISAGALTCFRLVVRSLFPRQDEVAAAEDFSAAGAPPT